jgi:[glutamine synthetase] adenylyltransferase / [glutamine synthetase]-adenylyl-L-tyrosine phosphorylase
MGFSEVVTDGSPAATPRVGAEHSRFVQRVRRRYGDQCALLAPGLPDAQRIGALIEALRSQGQPLGAALRQARQLTLERLACSMSNRRRPCPTSARP